MCTPRLQGVNVWQAMTVCDSVCLRQTFLFCSLSLAPSEPLLCKFADGGQKKRQSHNKFAQNGRGWARDGDSRLVSGAQDGVSGLMGANP